MRVRRGRGGKMFLGLLFVFLVISFLVVFISDQATSAAAEDLRSRISEGRVWNEVAAQINSDPHWFLMEIRDEKGKDCGSISGDHMPLVNALGGSQRNRGHLALMDGQTKTQIDDLLSPLVSARVEQCRRVRIFFHPQMSFTKVNFEITFDPTNRSLPPGVVHAWD